MSSLWPLENAWRDTIVPDDIELRLIKLTYEFQAGCTRCESCGRTLGRGLRISAQRSLRSEWRVQIQTRCWGWHRHRHTANISGGVDGFALGPLRRA